MDRDDLDEVFLTTKQVATLLQVTPRTIYNYRSDGLLEGFKISRKKIVYRGSDVLNLIQNSSSCIYMKNKARILIEKYIVRL